MTVIAAARRIQVLIGGQDWSNQVVSLEIGFNKRSPDGLLQVSGNLVLGQTVVRPELMDPRKNPSRWRRGQSVVVNIADINGIFQRHPCGFLFILKPPKPPATIRENLSIQLGCRLTLRDFFTANDDLSGIVAGTPRDRAAIVNQLLGSASAGVLIDPIPLYPINYPIPKQSGSYVQLAGKVAYGGLTYLWQDKQGNIRTASASLVPSVPVRQITAGISDAVYEPRDPSETPVEILKYAGTGKRLIDNWETESSTFVDYGSAAIVNPFASGTIVVSSGTDLLRQTRTRKTRNLERFTIQALVDFSAPSSGSLIRSEDVNEIFRYEAGIDGKLLSTEKTVKRTKGQTFGSLYQELTPPYSPLGSPSVIDTAEITRVDYDYDGQGRVRRIATQTFTPVGAIAPTQSADAINAEVQLNLIQILILSYEQVITYRESKKGTWIRRTRTLRPLVEVLRDYDFSVLANESERLVKAIQLINEINPSEPDFEVSNSGSTNPPATERRPPQWTEEDYPLEGSARFGILGGSDQPRERIISLDVGVVSQEQLSRLAQIEGSRILGEQSGVHIQIAFADLFFNLPPLQIWSVTEPDGWSHIYQADGLTFVHSRDRALVAADGIWLGSIPPVGGLPAPIEPSPGILAPVVPPYDQVESQSPDLDVAIPRVRIDQYFVGRGRGIESEYLPYSSVLAVQDFTVGRGRGGSYINEPVIRRNHGENPITPVSDGHAVGFTFFAKFGDLIISPEMSGYSEPSGPVVTPPPPGFDRWWRADLGVTESSGSVISWASSNGVLANSIDPAYRPTLTIVGSVEAIQFDGSNDFLLETGGSFVLGTVFIVARKTTATWNAFGGFVGMRTSSSAKAPASDETLVFLGLAGTNKVYGSGISQFFIDGVLQNSNFFDPEAGVNIGSPTAWHIYEWINSGSTLGTKNLLFGTDGAGSIGQFHLAVQLGEIVIYPTVLSAGDRTIVRNYLAPRYGL